MAEDFANVSMIDLELTDSKVKMKPIARRKEIGITEGAPK